MFRGTGAQKLRFVRISSAQLLALIEALDWRRVRAAKEPPANLSTIQTLGPMASVFHLDGSGIIAA